MNSFKITLYNMSNYFKLILDINEKKENLGSERAKEKKSSGYLKNLWEENLDKLNMSKEKLINYS